MATAQTAQSKSNKGVLSRDYARPSLDKVRLGGLVDIISNIGFNESAAKSKDVLGRVYEYFLGKFASAEGKGGGEFYTPQCVMQVLVAMLELYKGRVFETLQSAKAICGNRRMKRVFSLSASNGERAGVRCRNPRMNTRGIHSVLGKRWQCASTSGGMFVQSEKFVESHGGMLGEISIEGQESNATTRRLAIMDLALRGIETDFGPEHADTFRRDLNPDLRADCQIPAPSGKGAGSESFAQLDGATFFEWETRTRANTLLVVIQNKV